MDNEAESDSDIKVGLRVNDKAGNYILKLGSFVLAEYPQFASQIGLIAVEWAHAEAELGAYLAALMRTTPERTFALLAAYRNANSTADAALDLAKVTLTGSHLTEFESLIGQFRKLAKKRNAVQHAVWAIKSQNDNLLFRVTALEYTKFMTRVMQAEDKITLAHSFAAELNDSYSITALEAISKDARKLTAEMCSSRIGWHKELIWSDVMSSLQVKPPLP